MIHILLTTLKVIGILLAITLGILVSIILIVLFVPIRYSGNVNNLDISARVTWILHLLSVRLEFIDKKLKYKVKILGITILNSEKPKKIVKAAKKVAKETVDNTENKSEDLIKPQAEDKPKPKDKSQDEDEPHPKDKPQAKEKKSISQKLLEAINNIKFKIKNICDKIKAILKRISDYKDFLTTEESVTNIKMIYKMLLDLVLYFLPTKLKGNVKFGFDNPETTGKALGGICILYGVYADNITLEPDFENQVFEANVKFKGQIRLYRLLVVAFKIWKNQWIKKFIKFTKKH